LQPFCTKSLKNFYEGVCTSFGAYANTSQKKPLHFTYLWKQECRLYIHFPQTVVAQEETRSYG